ncbi:3-hydroxyacyl-CoA dehydrogenase [Sphingomonas sp. BIUV-7]|uniref:3-hydroxyacyl-CoA dehydrogenase n=1 Tax=Sphingomonas natans TaxID=3063330 RepID=A0ABT8YAD0_9SPHN|nr:3-hydroxyacyl-CoA dehydrogenase [Sphingomonas sp. BIUV-7]MDO6415270.1 3-hydroxyacyl-CoA dehydrogenase [Sphingomonas sp. BIUV-7]
MARAIATLGIVGTGVMGVGIAQIASTAGLKVRLFDARDGAATDAKERLRATFATLVAKQKIEQGVADDALSRLVPATDIADLADCDLVIEAILEDLAAKRQLIADLENIVAPDAVLATNTSSLSVTAIARACRKPERFAGFHFFNPVPLMRVIEVIPGFHTSAEVTTALLSLAERCGHRGVLAKDTPGFIINHAGRAFGTEALRLVEEGVADFAAIDRILREGAGFRMGPFELFDLTGLDVSHPATEAIFEQFYGDPRYRPSYLAQQRVVASQLGRKTGQGFYNYGQGSPMAKARDALPPMPIPPVWIGRSAHFDTAALIRLVKTLGGRIDEGAASSEGSLILVAPLGDDATTVAYGARLDARRVVAIDLLTASDRHRTLMTTPATDPAFAAAALTLFSGDAAGATLIRDSMGFVAQRVVAMVVNLASDIAQQRIASPADIDDAVRIGLGYPMGPLSWGDSLGPATILRLLERLNALSGDPRYRPSAWLRRRAQLGLSLLAEG